jgi:hypothetical protein
MKPVYDFRFVLIALLIVAFSTPFAQVKNSEKGSGPISVISASSPHAPAKINNTIGTYYFSASEGTFNSIDENGTVADSIIGDDASKYYIPLGFNFPYYGSSYFHIAACTNGWMSFHDGLNSATQYNGDLAFPGPSGDDILPFVAPFFGDLEVSRRVLYKTDGTPGNHTFTIQWDGVAGTGSTDSLISFQVILSEVDGVIKFVYLPGTGAISAIGAKVGVVDGNSNYLSVNDLVSTGALADSTNQNSVSSTPVSGLTFTWTPSGPMPVQATDFLASTDAGSVKLTWRTHSELDNAGFNILRKSQDASSFSLLSSFTSDRRLQGAGTSTTLRTYTFTDNSVVSGGSYKYKIQSVSRTGVTEDVGSMNVFVDVPKTYALYQNYPNPFNPSTTIRYDLNQSSTVTLEVVNILGQKVLEVNKGIMSAGKYNETLDLSHNASGIYFYRITAVGTNGEKFLSLKKMMLVK